MTREKWLGDNLPKDGRDRELGERAYDTLMGNVYESEGFPWSPYRCITPGKGWKWFHGIWNWDSAFHSYGVARWDTELAKEGVLGFFKFQREDGLLPDVIYENGEIISSFGKPPVFGWTVRRIYELDNDKDFLKEIYPKLVHNAVFWEEKRCYDGLFFYNADNSETDDYLMRVKYESGCDNSVRWDKGITEYWAVDLNCFMVMFYRSLSFIAKELDLEDESKKWHEKEIKLSELINEKLWDKEKQHYSDANKFTGEVSKVLTPASFMPLYIGIASKEQAEAMNIIAREKFRGKMPTVSFDNPEYSSNYWRGPTWLNVAYFAAKGLKNYGFEIADEIRESILNMCHEEKSGIYENYNSDNGKGLCCGNFSWSCVFIIEFLLDF